MKLRDLLLVGSLILIAIVTLRPLGGPTVIELSELDDALVAVREGHGRALFASVIEIAANVLLFVPFGAALGLRSVPIVRSVALGLFVSAAVELAQLLVISGRTFSLEDVLLNAVGAGAGQGIVRVAWPSNAAGATPRGQ